MVFTWLYPSRSFCKSLNAQTLNFAFFWLIHNFIRDKLHICKTSDIINSRYQWFLLQFWETVQPCFFINEKKLIAYSNVQATHVFVIVQQNTMLMNSEEFNGYLSTSQNNCKRLCKTGSMTLFSSICLCVFLQTNFILISFTKSFKYKLDNIFEYYTPGTIFHQYNDS